MSEEIIKSPVFLQKEQALKDLKEKKKKLLANLQKEKTKLDTFKEGFMDFNRNLMSRYMHVMEEMQIARKKYLAALAETQKSYKIPKAEKKQLKRLYKKMSAELESDIDPEEMIRQRAEADTDEWNRSSKKESPFDAFKSKISKEEQVDIRKVYIKLATQFHPDKAINEKEAEFFHTLMQRINTANELGDYAALLEIQAQYADYDSSKFDTSDSTVILDSMDQAIQALQNEVMGLNTQLERTKEEFKNIKTSPIGASYSEHLRDMNRYGESSISSELEDMENAVKEIYDTIEKLQDYAATGYMLVEEEDEEDDDPFFDMMSDFLASMDDDDDIPSRKPKKRKK